MDGSDWQVAPRTFLTKHGAFDGVRPRSAGSVRGPSAPRVSKGEFQRALLDQASASRSPVVKYTAAAVAGVSAGTWRPRSSPAGGGLPKALSGSRSDLLDG